MGLGTLYPFDLSSFTHWAKRNAWNQKRTREVLPNVVCADGGSFAFAYKRTQAAWPLTIRRRWMDDHDWFWVLLLEEGWPYDVGDLAHRGVDSISFLHSTNESLEICRLGSIRPSVWISLLTHRRWLFSSPTGSRSLEQCWNVDWWLERFEILESCFEFRNLALSTTIETSTTELCWLIKSERKNWSGEVMFSSVFSFNVAVAIEAPLKGEWFFMLIFQRGRFDRSSMFVFVSNSSPSVKALANAV